MTVSFGLGAGIGAHHYAKRDDTEPQKDTGPGKLGIYDKNIPHLTHMLNLEALCHLWNSDSNSAGADLEFLLCKGNLENMQNRRLNGEKVIKLPRYSKQAAGIAERSR